MRASRWVSAAILVAYALVFSGCGTPGGTGGRLEGVRWVLGSYVSEGVARSAPRDISIDALFDHGKVGGFSGVNTYQGSYKLSGDSLSVSKLASTLMAGPQELMDAEHAYLAALRDTRSFTATEGSLTLFDKDGKKTLEYSAGKTASLVEGTWNAISYYNGRGGVVSVINGTRLTAVFTSDGALTGSTGINDFKSTYQLRAMEITIAQPTIITNNTNPDQTTMQQEKDYLAALPLAARLETKEGRLDLLRADGGIAVIYELAK